MDRKRKVSGRQPAAAARGDDGMSSDEEDMEVHTPLIGAPPTRPTSTPGPVN